MTTFYKAIFSDGTVLTRSTASRKYTHAYLVRGHYLPEIVAKWRAEGRTWGETWGLSGFSGREDLAHAQARAKWDPTISVLDIAEVAPAIAITGPEYRAFKKAK